MDGYAHLARGSVLFTEDFDTPSAAAVEEPDVIEPVFSTGDLAAARSAAWQEGHAEGLRQAEAQDAAGTHCRSETVHLVNHLLILALGDLDRALRRQLLG